MKAAMARLQRLSETPTVLHFVGASLDVGGVLSYVRSLAAYNGAHNVLVVQKGFEQKRQPFLPLIHVSEGDYQSLFPPIAVWDSLRHVFWLRRRLSRRAGLILHGHSRGGVLLSLVMVLLGYRNVVVTIHHNGGQRWFFRFAHRFLEGRMYFLCPAMKRYYGLPGDNWRDCIPGSVAPALKRNRPQTAGPFGPKSKSELVLGGCGLITEWKRWETVLEAIGRLEPALRRRVSFLHVGDTLEQAIPRRYAERLREMVANLHLEEQVEWRGYQNDLNDFFDEIDLLVHPAHNEPLGLAVIEALFAGTPVLASESVGAVDLFQDDANGIALPDGDADAWAKVLAQILRGERRLPSVDQQSLRPLHPDYLGARWAEVYARLQEEPAPY